jgi:hypothetical protein
MKKKTSASKTTAENLESKFEEGENVLDYFDTNPKRVNVDFPHWTIQRLDQEAQRVGISRQALIKVWIAERLEKATVSV